jgi:uncharacterized protein YjiS (DUF1127 family)
MMSQLNVVYLDRIDLLTTLGRQAQSLISKVAAFAKRRAAYNEMMKLDDRMLADIGVVRADLESMRSGRPLL